MVLVDFSRLARELVARFNKVGQKHGVFQLIEMLDAFRCGKINKPHGGWGHLGVIAKRFVRLKREILADSRG
jgi:hypothetical protein